MRADCDSAGRGRPPATTSAPWRRLVLWLWLLSLLLAAAAAVAAAAGCALCRSASTRCTPAAVSAAPLPSVRLSLHAATLPRAPTLAPSPLSGALDFARKPSALFARKPSALFARKPSPVRANLTRALASSASCSLRTPLPHGRTFSLSSSYEADVFAPPSFAHLSIPSIRRCSAANR
eukprot:4333198-Pleurochrysis_carterae.AAC.1